ncbi:MAG: GxxExxY protein [Bacteroidota bacterium]|nr:GxxExxY protein [Bacteroidota bacterium]
MAAAFKVHNTLGSGFVEKVYENALAEELRQQEHTVVQQKRISVDYNGKSVGEFNTDLDVDNLVIVEVKAVKNFDHSFEDKLLHYLKATKFKVGLIINFADKVYIKRKVNSSANPSVQSEKSS